MDVFSAPHLSACPRSFRISRIWFSPGDCDFIRIDHKCNVIWPNGETAQDLFALASASLAMHMPFNYCLLCRNCLFMLISVESGAEIKWVSIRLKFPNELCKWWIAVDSSPSTRCGKRREKWFIENSQILTEVISVNWKLHLAFWRNTWKWHWISFSTTYQCLCVVGARTRCWSN